MLYYNYFPGSETDDKWDRFFDDDANNDQPPTGEYIPIDTNTRDRPNSAAATSDHEDQGTSSEEERIQMVGKKNDRLEHRIAIQGTIDDQSDDDDEVSKWEKEQLEKWDVECWDDDGDDANNDMPLCHRFASEWETEQLEKVSEFVYWFWK